MFSANDIEKYFLELNEELRKAGERGEIGMVGGAVMCIVFQSRQATRDVDAIFEPSSMIRDFAAKIAIRYNLPHDWLNDAVKAYLVDGFRRDEVFKFSHLTVWAPEPRYMLAMKCLSARWDGYDSADVKTLITHLNLKSAKDVFEIVEGFYPKNRIEPKTKFFIEEIFEPE